MSTISTETTATLARLDHALSVQDAMPVADAEWMPGDPLWDRPTWQHGEQYVRPMVEVREYSAEARCEPCGVGWRGNESCWMCGEERPDYYPQRWSPSLPTLAAEPNIEPFVITMRQVQEVFTRDMAPALERMGRLLASLAPPPNPHQPKPLAINGHEYARRRKGRR